MNPIALLKILPLATVAVILLVGVAVGTANADSHLPDCKANSNCLLSLGLKWTTLTAAEVQLMIDYGADVNATDDDGETPLYDAALIGNAEVISILVRAGADVNTTHDNGYTLLHGAAIFGNAEVIPALVKAGADVNARANLGETPLHNAMRQVAEMSK